MTINLQHLDREAPPKPTWWEKYRSSVFIGVFFGLGPVLFKYLTTMEMGILFVSLCIAYILWLCSRK